MEGFFIKQRPETLHKNVHCRTFQNIYFTVQKMKFSIKDFFRKCDQIHSFL